MKRHQNKFVVFCVVLAAIIYAANIAIDNPYTHSFINYYINEKFLKKLPIRAEYQSMRVQLLPPAIHLFGVKVKPEGLAATRQAELFSTSQASLSVSLWSLVLAKPQIGDLELHDLFLEWPPPPELMSAIAALEPRPQNMKEEPLQWPPKQSPPLSSLKIHNGTVSVRVDGFSLNTSAAKDEVTWITLAGAELGLDFYGWRDVRIEADVDQMNVTDRSLSFLEDAKTKLRGTLHGTDFRMEEFQIDSSRLHAKGDLGISIETGKPKGLINRLDLTGEADIQADLSSLGSILDLDATRGEVTGHINIASQIPIEGKSKFTLAVRGTAKSHQAMMSGFHLGDSEAEFVIEPDRVKFEKFHILSGDTSWGVASGFLMFNEAVDFEFKCVPTDLPLGGLLGVFNVPFNKINFDLSAPNLLVRGKGDPLKIAVTANAALTNFSTPPLNYSHTRHPESPVCQIELAMAIDNKAVKYDGTNGICRSGIKDDTSTFPLVMSGFTSYQDKTGVNLTLASPRDFSPGPLTFFAQAQLQGRGKMEAKVIGPYNDVKVKVETDISDFIAGSSALGHFSGRMQVDKDRVWWEQILITTSGGGEIQSKNGSILLDEDLTLDAEINAKMIDHVIMGAAIRDIVESSSTLEMILTEAKLSLHGPLMTPFAYTGNAELAIEGLRDSKQEYASTLTGKITSDKKQIKVAGGKVSIGNLSAAVNALIERNQPIDKAYFSGLGLNPNDNVSFDFKASRSSSDDDELQRMPFLGSLARSKGVKGVLSGDGKFSGTLQKVAGMSKLRIDHAYLLNKSSPSIASTLVVDGWKWDAIFDQGGNAVKGRLKFDLGAPGIPYDWFLSMKNFDLRPFFPASFALEARNFAYLTGSWSLAGKFDDWWNSNGEAEIKSIRARYFPSDSKTGKSIEIASDSRVQILIDATGWNSKGAEPFVFKSEYGLMRIALQKNRMPDHNNILIDGRVNVDILRFFMPDVEMATGQIRMNGGIYGSLDKPIVDLAVEDLKVSSEFAESWEPVSLGFGRYRPGMKNIAVRGRVRNGGIQVDSIQVEKGSGKISGSGYLALSEESESPTEFDFNLNNAAFVYPFPIVKHFDTSLDGRVRLSGKTMPLLLAGDLRINRARSNQEVDIREAILDSLRSSGNITTAINPAKLNFDLNISGDESISFNSRNIQAVLSSNMRINGSDVVPEISGVIDVKRGRFFYKRDFTIQRGLINYDDPVKADPSLDISATSEVSGYKVGINITGRASTPIIDFTIDPPTRQDGSAISKVDIFSLLNRGVLPDTSTATRGAESTAAAEALNILAGQVEDTVEKMFELSGQNIIRQVYIDTYASSDGSPVARFNLPLTLTDDLDLVLKVDQNTVNVSSEYNLHDSISVIGGIENSNQEANNGGQRQGAPADTGVDLKFRFSFQ